MKGGTVLLSGTINGHYADGEQVFIATLVMGACETLDFTVGYGSNGTYWYDSSGIRANITRASP